MDNHSNISIVVNALDITIAEMHNAVCTPEILASIFCFPTLLPNLSPIIPKTSIATWLIKGNRNCAGALNETENKNQSL